MASTTFIPSHVSHQNSFGRYRHVPGRNTADAYLAQQATRTSPATTSPSSTSSQSSFQKQAPVGGIRIAFCPPPVTAVSQQQQQQYEFNAHDDQSDPRHILAERFRTKLCRNYVSSSTTTISQLPDGSMTSVLSGGHCPYESRCMFAHGDHELRTAAMNIQDGLFTEDAIKAFKRAHRMAVREERDRAYQQQQMSMAPPSYDYAVATSSSASAAFVAVSAPQPIYNEEEVYSQEDAVGVSSYVAEDADDDARSLAGSFYGDDDCGCDYNNAAAPAVPAYRHNPYGLSSLYQNAVPESSSVACLSKNKDVPMVDAAPKRFIHAMP